MTIEERNKIPDRDRIKQYLEKTIRDTCDGLCDEKIKSMDEFMNAVNILMSCSQIYKNMGFDKAGGKNENT